MQPFKNNFTLHWLQTNFNNLCSKKPPEIAKLSRGPEGPNGTLPHMHMCSLTSFLDAFGRTLERPSEGHHRLAPHGDDLAPRDDGLGEGGVVAVPAATRPALVAEGSVVPQNWRPQRRELRLGWNLVKKS